MGYDMMLFSFEKAFDSCSHDALLQLLRAVGLPYPIVRATERLFSGPYCLTTFGKCTPARIDFERGIKQGCPLSPLLFVLLMEVLCDMLREIFGIETKMFADDTASGSHNIAQRVRAIKRAFQLFGDATGLRLNLSKTKLLTTRNTRGKDTIRRALNRIGWTQVAISEKEVYLGVLFGSGVQIGDNFYHRIPKFEDRIRKFYHLRAAFSTPTRAASANTFLLPVVMFPAGFFCCPSNLIKDIENNIYPWMDRFKSISGPHIIAHFTSLAGGTQSENFKLGIWLYWFSAWARPH